MLEYGDSARCPVEEAVCVGPVRTRVIPVDPRLAVTGEKVALPLSEPLRVAAEGHPAIVILPQNQRLVRGASLLRFQIDDELVRPIVDLHGPCFVERGYRFRLGGEIDMPQSHGE